MDEQNNNKNLVLTIVLSMLVVFVWLVFFPPPEPVVDPNAPAVTAASDPAADTVAVTDTADDTAGDAAAAAAAPRVPVDTPELTGTISMLGGRIDDLSLKQYQETTDAGSPDVRLLAPIGQENAYYAMFDWLPGAGLERADVPGARTLWQTAPDAMLTPDSPLVMTWANAKGLTFTRTISIDDKFMFTISDTVQNSGATEVKLAQRGVVARHGLPKLQNIFVVHEGLIRRTDGEFHELDYDEITELPVVEGEGAPSELFPASTDGWIGFTDHYWMTSLVPNQGAAYTSVAKYTPGSDIYQAEIREPLLTIAPGTTATQEQRLFAGAKEWETIGNYENKPGFWASLFGAEPDPAASPVPGFIDSIDWGWFFFLTKPIFAVLHWLNKLVGNMGLAIIGLTFFLKVLVLPLAYKSYVSMARMKELQPEIEALKERAGDDKQRMQKEMMQLYKERKVNPAAGCLPVLIQIPIFFSLYKVIFVTLELRQAPFFGWLNDLSKPDSSSLFNLFGLLPWDAPAHGTLLALIFIGILPILLGITMWLQQKLNPAPADPVQQQIFAWMPWVFMFMLGGFASGLVIYWITNNTITFTQQYLIMRSHGHKPDLFGNIKSGLKRTPSATAAVPTKTSTAKPAEPKVTTSTPANRPTPPRNRKPRK